MNFTKSGLKIKYENKKNNAKQRNIDFNLTETEFYGLCLYLKDNPYCSYTNKKFVFSTGSSYYPTLERVDSTKGYEISNCIWVSLKANQIKGKWEDFKAKQLTFTKEEFDVVQMILGNQSNVKEQLNKIYTYINKEQPIMSNAATDTNEPPQIDSKNITEDFNLAERYVGFVKVCKDFVDVELSFSEFKIMMKRKSCQLSGKVFEEQKHKFLWVIDKTKTVNKSNILIVDHLLSLHIDSMIAKSKLDNKQLKKVFTNLGKVL